MMDVLHFFFDSLPHFVGLVIVLCIFGAALDSLRTHKVVYRHETDDGEDES